MDQGIIVAILSILFYLTSLFGGQQAQPLEPVPSLEQHSYQVLGQGGQIITETATVRSTPHSDGKPLGVVSQRSPQVTILDHKDGWYKIRPSSGPTGWVPAYTLELRANQPKEFDQLILGYYVPNAAALESLVEQADKLTSVAPLGWQLDSTGRLRAQFDPQEMGRSLYFAGNQELETYAHVHLKEYPALLLADPQLQEAAKGSLVEMVQEWGLKGVILELGFTPAPGQSELYQFVQTLQAELGSRGLRTLLALPWQEGVDYAAASAAADYLIIQPMESLEKGPLAPLPRVEGMLAQLVQEVDSRKIVLALTTSGLDWSPQGSGQTLSHREVLELAAHQGAAIRWDAQAKSPFFHYGSGHEVWFENRYSLKHKLELVPKYKLGGVALANLGEEDSEMWTSLASLLIG